MEQNICGNARENIRIPKFVFILAILVLSVIVAIGCRWRNVPATPTPTATATSTAAPTPTPTPPAPSATATPVPAPTPTPDGKVDHTDPVDSGIITARTEISSREGKEKAFDNLYVTGIQNIDWSKWLDSGGVPSSDDPSWIQIELLAMVVVDKLVIVSANDDFGRDPEDFCLQASNDGSNWVTLATWSGEQFTGRFQRREFPFSNTTEYSRYRLEITKNDEDVAMTQLGEIELRGPEGGIPLPTPTPSPTPSPTPVPRSGNARIVELTYETQDIVVVDYDVVSDYGADATGASDATSAIQQALNDCHSNGGGTVWVPAGTYQVTRSILVKPFCTLRGDWQDPDIGTDYGTVIRAEIPTGDTPLFLIGGSAGVVGVTVYYPNQNASSPVEYGWTFEVRGNGDALGTGAGNYNYHASSIVNVTMLNSYRGIGLNAPPYETDVHELSRVENIRATVLYRGIDARNCADVGMWRHITFSNRYWAGAPAAYNPPSRTTLDTWTRANGEAFVFADVEWDSFYEITADSFNVGIHLVKGARIAFAGQFAWVQITDTDIAIQADADSIDHRSPNWGASFLRSMLEGSQFAVQNDSIGYIHIADSTVTGGIRSKYSKRVSTENPGTSPNSYTEHGTPQKPTRAVLYDVSKPPYNAPTTQGRLPAGDATSAIQVALDEAGAAGGGVVYLPAGWYRIDTALTVPANVELRGASSVMNRSQSGLSIGTVLWAYQEGSTRPALVTLDGNASGVRGLRIFYPNNAFNGPGNWIEYPYAIRINGVDDAYVVNVAIENGYQGVVAEAGSDAHYLKNVVGATTHGFIRIWDSASGWIEDCHTNPNFWMRLNGYGVTPWAEDPAPIRALRKANDRLIQIDNAANEHLMNNFTYAGLHGVHTRNANVNVFNIGTDNVGGYTVLNEPGSSGTVNVMNSMRYNGDGNTSGVATSLNELSLD